MIDLVAVSFDWSYLSENWEELAWALKRTLEVSAIAIFGAFLIGLTLGAARAARVPVISQLAAVYVEIIRNTPILVQIFFYYFGLGSLGEREFLGITIDFRFDAFTIAWMAVMIWGGAFNTENFRAGFEAVPKRFHEAGLALGFSRVATFFNVTLPIGGRMALAPSINTYISVVKNTSLMYVIAYPELTTVALQINALTLETTETFTVLAITYLTIVWSLSAVIRLLESHLALPEEAK
jgi:polar amino acid transport system permease protein